MAAVRSPVLYPPSPKQSAVGLRKGFLDIGALQEQELQYNQWVSLNPSLWYSFGAHGNSFVLAVCASNIEFLMA